MLSLIFYIHLSLLSYLSLIFYHLSHSPLLSCSFLSPPLSLILGCLLSTLLIFYFPLSLISYLHLSPLLSLFVSHLSSLISVSLISKLCLPSKTYISSPFASYLLLIYLLSLSFPCLLSLILFIFHTH